MRTDTNTTSRRGLVAASATLALGAALVVAGQAHAAVVPAAQIPAVSPTAAGFAPPGWRVEKRAVGHLDDDGRNDLAIVLIQSSSSGGAYGAPDGSRALVLARALAAGGFTRAGLAPKLLGCRECGGAFWGAAGMPVTVTISGRAVVVRQQFGSREVTRTTHRIRWNAPRAKFRLVGMDSLVTDRLKGTSVAVSTNHLTRRQTTIRRRGKAVLSRSTRTVVVSPRAIAALVFGRTRP